MTGVYLKVTLRGDDHHTTKNFEDYQEVKGKRVNKGVLQNEHPDNLTTGVSSEVLDLF